MADAFWIDFAHDRHAASDGISRYGYYVRQRIPGGFAQCWDGTYETRLAEHFAVLAWRTATSPVMAPPYAHWCAPVLSAQTGIDGDGDSPGLIATVEIASRWPQVFGRGYAGGQSWWPWRRENFGGKEFHRGPYSDEVARGGYYAVASLRLVFPIPAALLPDAPGSPHRRGGVEETARTAVAAIVYELNRVVSPVIEALERP